MKTGYLPEEDQGIILIQAILPQDLPWNRQKKVMRRVEQYIQKHEQKAIKSFASVIGYSYGGQAQNMALGFIHLRDWSLRKQGSLSAKAVVSRLMRQFSTYNDAMVFAFMPPPIIELGNAAGFDFELLDYGGVGYQKLLQARNQLLYMAFKDPRLIRVRPNGMNPVVQYKIDIDWEKAGALKLPISSIHNNIAAAIGSAYVNDFVKKWKGKKRCMCSLMPHIG